MKKLFSVVIILGAILSSGCIAESNDTSDKKPDNYSRNNTPGQTRVDIPESMKKSKNSARSRNNSTSDTTASRGYSELADILSDMDDDCKDVDLKLFITDIVWDKMMEKRRIEGTSEGNATEFSNGELQITLTQDLLDELEKIFPSETDEDNSEPGEVISTERDYRSGNNDSIEIGQKISLGKVLFTIFPDNKDDSYKYQIELYDEYEENGTSGSSSYVYKWSSDKKKVFSSINVFSPAYCCAMTFIAEFPDNGKHKMMSYISTGNDFFNYSCSINVIRNPEKINKDGVYISSNMVTDSKYINTDTDLPVINKTTYTFFGNADNDGGYIKTRLMNSNVENGSFTCNVPEFLKEVFDSEGNIKASANSFDNTLWTAVNGDTDSSAYFMKDEELSSISRDFGSGIHITITGNLDPVYNYEIYSTGTTDPSLDNIIGTVHFEYDENLSARAVAEYWGTEDQILQAVIFQVSNTDSGRTFVQTQASISQ